MNSAQWLGWIPLIVGLLIALVVGGTGSFLFSRRHVRRRARRATKRAPSPVTPQPPPGQEAYDPFEFGSPEDKRQAVRRAGRPVTVLVSDATTKAEPVRGTVVDRSISGIRLRMERPFEVGDVLSVRVSHAAEMIPWTRIEVRNRADTPEGCEIGCRFVGSVPTSVLWMFG